MGGLMQRGRLMQNGEDLDRSSQWREDENMQVREENIRGII